MAINIPQDEKSQTIMVGVAVVVIAAAAYWNYMWKPEQAQINIVAARADTLDSLNTIVRRQIKTGMEATLRADGDRYAEELIGLRRLVPTGNEVPALLESISSAARQSGLELSEITPDGDLTGDHFDMKRYKLGVTGPYHKVAEFLTAVGSLPRIITPINLTLAPSGQKLERKPGKDETFIDAKFGVLTYVAKTAPPSPPGAK
jgi:type IV pilus assembly protein PilO